jgi:hypothetical protein
MQFRAVICRITPQMPATGNRADPDLKLPWFPIEEQTADPAVPGGEIPTRSSPNGRPGQADGKYLFRWTVSLQHDRLRKSVDTSEDSSVMWDIFISDLRGISGKAGETAIQ